jgi:hypothetical protein
MTDFDAIAAEFGDEPGGTNAAPIMHTGPLWLWRSTKSDAPAGWYFITLDGPAADAIRARAGPRRGFGSVRVEVRIGSSVWKTSVFPAKEVGGYMLPVKATVRKAEKLAEGGMADVELTLA